MNEQNKEILLILQEECAEVIQAISKVFRFGVAASHPNTPNKTNMYSLQEEIGDLLAMVELLENNGAVNREMLFQFKKRKFEKLKLWSTVRV
jgi:NTP pyrophosphatase (non-canonical NTP hydrolase)